MMSFVIRGNCASYVNEGTFSNCLIGNPTGRLKLGSSTRSVAFQSVDESLSLLGEPQKKTRKIRGLGVWKRLFYFPQKVEIDEKETWVLINRRSARKWLAGEGVFVIFRVADTFLSFVGRSQIEEGLSKVETTFLLPEVRKLISQKGLSKRAEILRELQVLFPASEALVRALDRSVDRFGMLKLCVVWGHFVDSIREEDSREKAVALMDSFIGFGERLCRKRDYSDQSLLKAFEYWQAAEKMLSIVAGRTSLSRGEFAELLLFIHEKQPQIVWSSKSSRALCRPQMTGLARSVLFFKDGRVVIQFNRKGLGDCVVGKGAYSIVKTGLDVNAGKLIALSTTSAVKRGSLREREYPIIFKGYSVATQIGEQRGVVSMWEVYEKQSKKGVSKCVVLMELIEGKGLFELFAECKFSPDWGQRWSLEFLEGLTHIHEKGVIHNDLKPANVMVDTEGTLWIIDFGFAAKADAEGRGDPSVNAGNPGYSAPQRFKEGPDKVHQKHDIWAAGAILWDLLSEDVQLYFKWTTYQEMWTQLVKKHSGDVLKIAEEIIKRPVNWFLKEGMTLEKLKQETNRAAQMACLIAQMLHSNRKKRPTAAEALKRLQEILDQDAGPA